MVSIIDINKDFTLDETKELFCKHGFTLYTNLKKIIRFDKDTHVGYALLHGSKYKIVIYKRIKK